MATQADVLNALKARAVLATANVILDGARLPRTVIKGWPSRKQLEVGLQKGSSFISAYLPPHMERNVTKYFPFVQTDPPPADLYVDEQGSISSIKRVVWGQSVTFLLESTSGTLRIGENVSIKVVRPLTTFVIAHQILSADTTSTITADLANQFNGLAIAGLTASASGNVLTVGLAAPGQPTETLDLEIGTVGTSRIEAKRQKRKFWVIVWAPSAEKRDAFSAALDGDFGLFITPGSLLYNRIALGDIPSDLGIINYAGSWPDDREQEQKNWRQTFELEVEYSSYYTVPVSSEIVGVIPTLVIEQPPSQVTQTQPLLPPPACVTQTVLDELAAISIG